MKKVILSLGSNLLNREFFIKEATKLINCRVGNVVRSSSMIETESWGFQSHPFLNQILIATTTHSPEEVLEITQGIEHDLGRTEKSGRDETGKPIYHDRTIDIDILIFEGETRNTTTLTIPHPLIANRKFILEPLTELFDDQIIPPFKESFKQLLNKL